MLLYGGLLNTNFKMKQINYKYTEDDILKIVYYHAMKQAGVINSLNDYKVNTKVDKDEVTLSISVTIKK